MCEGETDRERERETVREREKLTERERETDRERERNWQRERETDRERERETDRGRETKIDRESDWERLKESGNKIISLRMLLTWIKHPRNCLKFEESPTWKISFEAKFKEHLKVKQLEARMGKSKTGSSKNKIGKCGKALSTFNFVSWLHEPAIRKNDNIHFSSTSLLPASSSWV